MLTRRNFFIVIIMFVVVFIMFMLVDISAGYLTRREYNPQADLEIIHTAKDAFNPDVLNTETSDAPLPDDSEDSAAPAPSASPATALSPLAQMAMDNPRIAILSARKDTENVSVMTEWCVYTKHRYQVYTALPELSEIQNCRALFFDGDVASEETLPRLLEYAESGLPMIFAQLPDYAALSACPELADFFGIGGFVMEELPLKGVYIFDDFFIGGDRIYALDDDFGDTDAGVPLSVPYYSLRPGYLMFAQAIAQDASIDYKDLPGLLWRTRTENADVFVANTDLFAGKNLLGLLTAFMSQTESFFVYPIVNAQTISVVDFPLLSKENEEALRSLYSRDSEALCRDVLWPAAVMILRNYEGSYNFFMAPQLDYADDAQPESTFISFYRKEIERLSGTLGLSMQQISSASLSDQNNQNAAFLSAAMPEYKFTAGCVTRKQLEEIQKSGLFQPMDHMTLLMTDLDHENPLLEYINDKTIAVSFTTDGFIHETNDDLRLLCLETALGLNTQKVEMSKAIYPENGFDWNALSLLWSRGDTFQKPFRDFETSTIYQLEENARIFLAVDYSATCTEDTITLNVENGVMGSSFILRLFGREIENVTGGKMTQLSDTAYLLQPDEAQMQLTFSFRHTIKDAPTTYQEVISK